MSISIQYNVVLLWAATWACFHGWQLKRSGRGAKERATESDIRFFHGVALAFCCVNGAQALVKMILLAPSLDLALHVHRLMMNAAIMGGVGVLAWGAARGLARSKLGPALSAVGLHSVAMGGMDLLFVWLFQH